jgi:hypothetical protein
MVMRFPDCVRSITMLASSLFVASCSNPPTVFVTPEYAEKAFADVVLAVAPFGAAVINDGDVTDDLGKGNPERVYLDYMTPRFLGAIRGASSFREVVSATPRGPIQFEVEARSFPAVPKRYHTVTDRMTRGGSMKVHLPIEGTSVAFNDLQPDFVLFIEDLLVSREMSTLQPGELLVHSAEFVIWDNRAGAVVSYGRVTSGIKVIGAMTDKTWAQGIASLGRDITAKTPFDRYRRPSQ